MNVCVAGLRLHVNTAKALMTGALSRHLAPYACENNATIDYRVDIENAPDKIVGGRRFKNLGHQPCYDDGRCFAVRTKNGFMCIDWDAQRVSMCPDNGAAGPATNLRSLLNALACTLVVGHGGLAIHSSSVSSDGKALVFCGKSDKGKSTLASMLCPPFSLIDDDAVVALPLGRGKWRVYPMPFRSPTRPASISVSAELTGLYSVGKALSHALHPIHRSEQFRRLLSNTFHLRSSQRMTERILRNADALLNVIEMKTFMFSTAAVRNQPLHGILEKEIEENELRTET